MKIIKRQQNKIETHFPDWMGSKTMMVLVPSRTYMGVKIPVVAGRDLYIAQDVYFVCTFPSRAFVSSLPSPRFFLSNLGLSAPRKRPDTRVTSRLLL